MNATLSLFGEARKTYHSNLLNKGVLCMVTLKNSKRGFPAAHPSNADSDNLLSIQISQAIFDQIGSAAISGDRLAGQRSGRRFEQVTAEFLEKTFTAVALLRPGKWNFKVKQQDISQFEQYHHLQQISERAKEYPEIAMLLGGDYIIAPDIVILRKPESDSSINRMEVLVDDTVALQSGLREKNSNMPLLHASISCKWTLRSDRAQNARSEALNLIRNRKGRAPHIVLVTGEPLPSRLASIVLGTGDLDCVYHFALRELIAAVSAVADEEAVALVKNMIDGQRLKDITDLPLDLAV